ncbi:hypothetical protein EHI8A_086580 [Entamoeba histolytica HM-1:IMSS-B]|uniref:Ral GTPase-activating protein subunit alpha/beta N-terminal domain-containing protein n=6 Tax=Entamoeba histolytica TaxID=5759 RepID=C4M7F4_ENTH1|nr:hypothetical protein EHI_166480 [Entamoeba histolytica HM-1:IMSS]EAL46875.2 hypothetical protein EHI_166480 [Entamoeba histolytica HM-1:IMSS]EMH74350.1 hypothetical protein EHI8A_086580 [Entamoeba histolytica HM-1:IMSS-B]ENY60232.1 hypothetical protein EHI7A_076720 [Entamoeba histolytica HM-1:IMSS-A]GAT97460.1 hypothetical protein CL6EHI_166480 [Entamoeba histolytica]|eukprot:XP_652261.2 hypothetical protein EHI_166480 [Entamoeba histolytica HM-1:IMSS]
MFIDTTNQLGLKEYLPTSNIYQMFENSIQTLIATNISNQIINNIEEFNQKIKTPTHFEYLLESLGFAFVLPMESSQTIGNTISIYHQWLFGDHIPKAIQDNRQKYLNCMLEHLSLIFTQRSCSTNQTNQMVEFCNRVMDIYDLALNDNVVDTHNVICLLIGAIHSLATMPKQSITAIVSSNVSSNFYKAKEKKSNLADEISGRVINTLYRAWIKLLPQDKLLWMSIIQHHKTWSILLPVAQQWKVLMKKVTEGVMNQLYNNKECLISLDGFKENTTIQNVIAPKYAYNFWICCLHFIGTPLISNNASVVEVIIQSISEQVDYMIQYHCTGETILRVYNILFQCVILPSHLKFEQGVCCAMETLLKIFISTCEYTTFTKQSLDNLYYALSYALSSESEKVLAIGLKGYVSLIGKSFEGMEILAKTALYAVHRASLLKETIFVDYHTVFIDLLASLMYLPDSSQIHFIPKQSPEFEEKYSIQSLIVLNLYLLLKHEVDASRIASILTLINRYFIQELPFNKPQEDFNMSTLNQVPPKTVGGLAWYFVKLIEINHSTLFVTSKPEIHRLIFTILKNLIKYHSSIPKSDEFINSLFDILNELFNQWIRNMNLVIMGDCLSVITLYYQSIMKNITQDQMTKLTALYKKLTSVEGYDKKRTLMRLSDIPNEGLEYFTMSLSQSIAFVYQHLMIPKPIFGSQLLNCQVSEKNIVDILMKNNIKNVLDYIYIVTVDNMVILSFIELPFKNISGEKQFMVLVRDCIGKKGYLISLNEIDDKIIQSQHKHMDIIDRPERDNLVILSDEKVLEELQRLENVSTCNIDSYIKTKEDKYQPPLEEDIPQPKYIDIMNVQHGTKYYAVRLFLTTMGFCSSNFWKRLTPIKTSLQVLETLDEIDKMSNRTHVGISIQNKEQGITKEFMQFIQELGVIRSTTGFEGLKEGYEDKEHMICYQDDFVDVIYHVKSLIPVNDKIEDLIEIYWGENDQKLEENPEKLLIEIKILHNGIYQIKSNQTSSTLLTLQRSLIYSLGRVIRESCIRFIEKRNLHEMTFPYDSRCITIQDFCTSNTTKGHSIGVMDMLVDRELSNQLNVEKLSEVKPEEPKEEKRQAKTKSSKVGIINVFQPQSTPRMTGELKATEEMMKRKMAKTTNGSFLGSSK